MMINVIKTDFGISGLDSHIINLLELFPGKIRVFTAVRGMNRSGFFYLDELKNFSISNENKNLNHILSKTAIDTLIDCDLLYVPNGYREENTAIVKQLRGRIPIINRCGNLAQEKELANFKNFELTVVPSNIIKKDLDNRLPGTIVKVVYNYVPDRFYEYNVEEVASFKRDIGIQDSVILLYPGRISSSYHKGVYTHRKGIEEIILSLTQGVLDKQSIVLLVGGEDVYQGDNPKQARDKLITFAKTAGLDSSRIVFIQETYCQYEQFHIAVQASDIMLHPNTRVEPFGQAVLESMACGKPVVVTIHTGSIEISRNNKVFFDQKNKGKLDMVILPSSDPRNILRAMEILLDNKKLRERIGANAKITASSFTKSYFKDKFISTVLSS